MTLEKGCPFPDVVLAVDRVSQGAGSRGWIPELPSTPYPHALAPWDLCIQES